MRGNNPVTQITFQPSKALVVLFILLASLFAVWFFFRERHVVIPTAERFHFSAFSGNPEFYEASQQPVPESQPYRALITSHHLLAKNQIAKTFQSAASSLPLTLVVIAPDHFSRGKNVFTSSPLSWQTPFGLLEPDLKLFEQLKSQTHFFTEDPDTVNQEHAIGNLAGYIKQYFPNSKILPLLVKNSASEKQLSAISHAFKETKQTELLFVGSFDFSHYLPKYAADFHDQVSLEALQTFNVDQGIKLDMDSQAGLTLLLSILKFQGSQHFVPFALSNAQDYALQDQLETTGYIFGGFTKGTKKEPDTDSLVVLPRIEAGSTAIFTQRHKKFAFKYLERLFFGQSQTLALNTDPQLHPSSNLLKIGLKTQAPTGQTQKIVMLNWQIKISNDDSCIEDAASALHICQGQENKAVKNKSGMLKFYLAGLKPEDASEPPRSSLGLALLAKPDSLEVTLLPLSCKEGACQLQIGQRRDIMLKNALLTLSSGPLQQVDLKAGKIILKLK